MSDATCPVCCTDDVEYIGTNPETGEDEYFCDECQQNFTINWDDIDENSNAYPDEYYDDFRNKDEEYEEEY